MDTNFDRLTPLSARDLSRIHQASVDLLVHTGMWVESERARELYRKHGCRVEGERVHFTERVIDESLASAPSKFVIRARNPRWDLELGVGNFYFAPTGGPALIIDYDGTERSATFDDYCNALRLTQASDVIEVNRGIAGPNAKTTLDYTVPAMQLTDKVIELNSELDMQATCILYGISKERLKEDASRGVFYGFSTISPLSPLGLTEMQSDVVFATATYSSPQQVAPMPIAGTSAPCTLPGLLITQNAEELGVLVLSQFANPGTPVIYGCIGTITDMKAGGAPIGVPEARIIEAAACQIARFYGLPTRGDGGFTDSCCSDFQAGAEGALQYYNAVRIGLDFIPGAGTLGSWAHGSFEKFVLDCEIIGYVKRIFQPLEFTAETMALDTVRKVGPRGNYLVEPHTLSHCRSEFYSPSVFSRVSYERWDKDGRRDAAARAHAKVLHILANFEPPALDKSIEKDLDKLWAANR